MKKTLWEYMCECEWTVPIIGTISALTFACVTGRWMESLVTLACIWIFSLVMIYSIAKRSMRKDIERENREPKSCPDCGHKTKSEYCENCGKWLYAPETPNRCYYCGRECTTKFCGRCGAPH